MRPPLYDFDGYGFRITDTDDQLIERRSRLQHLTLDLVSANDDATCTVPLIVPVVDENAEEVRYVMEIRELPLEPWVVLHRHLVGSGRDGGLGVHFLRTGARHASRGIGAHGRQITHPILDRVREVHPVDVEFADGVVFALEYALES